MKATITRNQSTKKQTLGDMSVTDDNGEIIFSCKTLEPPWKYNRPNVSCIPTGTYNVTRKDSGKFKDYFHIMDVPNRTYILIHPGNYYTQIKGCVLVGGGFSDINSDGYLDVTNSRNTMNKLLELMPDIFELTIEEV